MGTNFFELATTLKNLGAKWLSEKKLISRPADTDSHSNYFHGKEHMHMDVLNAKK